MSTTTPPDRDVYNLLVDMNGLLRETAGKVDSMHHELLGENGHIARLDDHIGRLYKRTEKLAEKDIELEKQIGDSAQPARTALDRVKFAGIVLFGSIGLIDVAVRVATFLRGAH